MASTYLTRTLGTPTSQKIFTFSTWLKKSLQDDAGTQHIFDSFYSVDNRLVIYFQGSSTDTFAMYNRSGASETMYMNTNMKFRDTNGWYHIYIAVDTTQSTASDRVKFYINGEQVTSWETSNYPAQNSNINIVSGYTNYIGRYGGGGNFFNGCMSHYYYVDGSVIDIAQFGSTDSTTGEWKINTNPTIASYGNQEFYTTPKDAKLLIQSESTLKYKTLYSLALVSGARTNELLAACYDDFKNNTWTIQNTLDNDNVFEPGSVKTIAGYRTVDITTEVTALVKSLQLLNPSKQRLFDISKSQVKYHTQKLAASIGIAWQGGLSPFRKLSSSLVFDSNVLSEKEFRDRYGWEDLKTFRKYYQRQTRNNARVDGIFNKLIN
jgi:hypothetical protein